MSPASSSTALTSLILDRLVADGHDSESWSYLVLAACEGPAELTKVLDGD